MRIALIEFYGIGGTADYTDCLAGALSRRGHEITVVTSTLYQPVNSRVDYDIMPLFRYEPSEPKWWKAAKLASALEKATRQLQALQHLDVLHAQGTVIPRLESKWYGTMRAHLRVCTVHDVEAHESRPWLGSYARFYSAFDALVCHSQAARERLRELIEGVPVTVIPHARYAPLAAERIDKRAARRALQLPEESSVALFFGFVRRYKGLEVFVDAIDAARHRDPALMGHVAGRPLYDISDVVEQSEHHSVPIRWDLRFIPRWQIPVYFSAADVVALPYISTTDSGIVELAAAFEKPVVVTDSGGLVEAFLRYGYGAIVKANDPAALADALVDVKPIAHPTAPGVSWDEAALMTERWYESLLSGASLALSGRGAA